ncbi:hypothetical protein HYALB_00001030 [Hymenoscyphus albidus]|uniref:Uncharacterized protein n=1 Tax=Hymenoscyphus albidus TaxID=595503 RepID=A0A9N9M271_9HELO|nr:hypothetical protein HYALB_00001030 [Hymenoscyphus albidus]
MPLMHHENGVGPTEGEGITSHMVMDSEQLLCPSPLENLVILTGPVRMEGEGQKSRFRRRRPANAPSASVAFTEYGAGAQTKPKRQSNTAALRREKESSSLLSFLVHLAFSPKMRGGAIAFKVISRVYQFLPGGQTHQKEFKRIILQPRTWNPGMISRSLTIMDHQEKGDLRAGQDDKKKDSSSADSLFQLLTTLPETGPLVVAIPSTALGPFSPKLALSL